MTSVIYQKKLYDSTFHFKSAIKMLIEKSSNRTNIFLSSSLFFFLSNFLLMFHKKSLFKYFLRCIKGFIWHIISNWWFTDLSLTFAIYCPSLHMKQVVGKLYQYYYRALLLAIDTLLWTSPNFVLHPSIFFNKEHVSQ